MKILVTGGSGFIGSRLVRQLVDKGVEVCVFDKERSKLFPDISIVGDVRDLQALSSAVRGCDVVVHLAAEHRDDVSPASDYYEVNVGGATNLAQACTVHGVSRIIFTSTVAIYGLNVGEPTEASPPQPFNDYGKSKFEAETVLKKWAEAEPSRSLRILRPAVVFGEGNRGNVYNLIRQIATRRFMMVGNGLNRKSMAYVGNVAAFLSFSAESTGSGVEVFNYADKPDFSMNDLVHQVKEHVGTAKGFSFRIPFWLGVLGGTLLDGLAGLSGRSFPVSAVRVRKFCASTTVSVSKLQHSEFTPPFSLTQGMCLFLQHELPSGRE